jgi:hypothetical protein
VPYGEAEYPVGSIDKVYSSVATMHGFEVVRHTVMDLILLKNPLKFLFVQLNLR